MSENKRNSFMNLIYFKPNRRIKKRGKERDAGMSNKNNTQRKSKIKMTRKKVFCYLQLL